MSDSRECHTFNTIVYTFYYSFLAIVIMVLIDFFVKDTYTEKLDVPDSFGLTDPDYRSRIHLAGGWIINPFPKENFPFWVIFVSIVPAILLFTLLFMETHICEYV